MQGTFETLLFVDKCSVSYLHGPMEERVEGPRWCPILTVSESEQGSGASGGFNGWLERSRISATFQCSAKRASLQGPLLFPLCSRSSRAWTVPSLTGQCDLFAWLHDMNKGEYVLSCDCFLLQAGVYCMLGTSVMWRTHRRWQPFRVPQPQGLNL